MKAIVTRLRGDGGREKRLVEDWPSPSLERPHDVVVRAIVTGVTVGTERNDLLGNNYARPDEMLPAGRGYQHVGEVVDVGPAVTKFTAGDVVFSGCDHLERAVVPEDGLIVAVRDGASPRSVALLGVAAVAHRSVAHAHPVSGEDALVVGAGVIGQIAVQLLRGQGLHVDMADLDAGRLALAKERWGVRTTYDASEKTLDPTLPESTYDIVLDFAGEGVEVDDLIRALRQRGRLLLIGGRHEVRYNFNAGQIHEITLMQNTHFDRQDLEAMAAMVSQGKVQLEPLISHDIDLAQVASFYDELRDDPSRILGAVIHWDKKEGPTRD